MDYFTQACSKSLQAVMSNGNDEKLLVKKKHFEKSQTYFTMSFVG